MANAVARLLLANALYDITPILKNGAGGAPAVSEDADRPMVNLKISSRYRFWRTPNSPTSPMNVDFDMVASNTIKTVGMAMHRAYRGAAGVTSVTVYSGTGSSYPPASWTARGTFAVNYLTDNDVFMDIATTTARFWRFTITASGQYSCKLWLARSADVISLTQGGAGAIENPRRVREREKETFLGGRIFNDLGIGVAERIRELRIPMPVMTQAQLNAIRTSQRGNLIYQHVDGKYYEVRHLETDQISARLEGVTARYQTQLAFAQVP